VPIHDFFIPSNIFAVPFYSFTVFPTVSFVYCPYCVVFSNMAVAFYPNLFVSYNEEMVSANERNMEHNERYRNYCNGNKTKGLASIQENCPRQHEK